MPPLVLWLVRKALAVTLWFLSTTILPKLCIFNHFVGLDALLPSGTHGDTSQWEVDELTDLTLINCKPMTWCETGWLPLVSKNLWIKKFFSLWSNDMWNVLTPNAIFRNSLFHLGKKKFGQMYSFTFWGDADLWRWIYKNYHGYKNSRFCLTRARKRETAPRFRKSRD